MTHPSSTNEADRIRGGLTLLTTISFTEIPRLCFLTISKVVSKRVFSESEIQRKRNGKSS